MKDQTGKLTCEAKINEIAFIDKKEIKRVAEGMLITELSKAMINKNELPIEIKEKTYAYSGEKEFKLEAYLISENLYYGLNSIGADRFLSLVANCNIQKLEKWLIENQER